MREPDGQSLRGDAYDRLAYPGHAYTQTHPARLEILGRLFGLTPAGAAGARILELGCGDGGNSLSLATALPDATVVGIDLNRSAIERGVQIAAAAGLRNAELRCADVSELPDDLGLFDYVLAHGVYSWIPPHARSALLGAARRLMTPDGLAYVSYNAYPGSHLRVMAREILRYHVRDIDGAAAQLAAAHELMQTIVAIEEPTPYARVLREHLERTLTFSNELLFHDDLAEVSTPFYFHEFMEHAASHGLQFLCEADLAESQMAGVPQSAADLMAALEDDVVAREQYLDFFKNRVFRMTLLCQAEASVNRVLDTATIRDAWISGHLRPTGRNDDGETFENAIGITVTSSESLICNAMRALGEAWPAATAFPELLSAAGGTGEADGARLLDVVLQSYLARLVELRGCPPPLRARPGERPRASSLARAQHAAGRPILATLRHANARLDGDGDAELFALLDGTRDQAALCRELAAKPAAVELSLARIAGAGLLEA